MTARHFAKRAPIPRYSLRRSRRPSSPSVTVSLGGCIAGPYLIERLAHDGLHPGNSVNHPLVATAIDKGILGRGLARRAARSAQCVTMAGDVSAPPAPRLDAASTPRLVTGAARRLSHPPGPPPPRAR